MEGTFVLELPEQVGLPLAAKRTAQAGPDAWPGTRIASADSLKLEQAAFNERFAKIARTPGVD